MNGVRQRDLVKVWGLSKQRVSELVAEGMPLESVEAATAWRAERYGGNGGKLLNLSLQEKGARLPAPPEPPRAEDLERLDVHGVYARLMQAERSAWESYAAALATGELVLIRGEAKLYSESVRMRLAAEKDVLAVLQARGDLVPGSLAAEVVGRVLEAVRVLMLAQPSRVAARVNQDDPDLARGVLAADVAEMFGRVRALADGGIK